MQPKQYITSNLQELPDLAQRQLQGAAVVDPEAGSLEPGPKIEKVIMHISFIVISFYNASRYAMNMNLLSTFPSNLGQNI